MTPTLTPTAKKARRELQVVLEARYFNGRLKRFVCPIAVCGGQMKLASWASFRGHMRYYHGLWAVREYLL